MISHSILVQEVSADIALGGALILVAFGPLHSRRRYSRRSVLDSGWWHWVVVGGGCNCVSFRIVPRWRLVTCELTQISCLICLSTGLPRLLFGDSKLGIHCGGIFRKLSERHARINRFELLTHCVLVKQISRHVALWRPGILDNLGHGIYVLLFLNLPEYEWKQTSMALVRCIQVQLCCKDRKILRRPHRLLSNPANNSPKNYRNDPAQ
mmetsp:Transcript_26301/g.37694  ORF Transcript_26301/g.37694 Transcript_26301/m.37694 type:complete len:209 (-) Transcript_26301:131-757(-)